MPTPPEFDVAVVGAGPAGLATALACARMGLSTIAIGPPADRHDGRTAALFSGSIAMLQNLDVWEPLAAASEPLRGIRLIDATDNLLRAPEVTFKAREIGLDAFGYNVPNAALSTVLERAAGSRLKRISKASVASIVIESGGVTLGLSDATELSARLVAAADGRGSACRTAAGIETYGWSYDQSAVVTTLAHTRSHEGISCEFHRRSGPLTLVPGPERTSSLVWVETPAEADRLAALDDDAFAAALSRQLNGLLGVLSDFKPRRMFRLSGQTAQPLALRRIALIGEAGHVIPPIGAQGLNLSLRDAAILAELAHNAQHQGQDIGSDANMARYDALRRLDVTARVWTVDLLNRSLLSNFAPMHMARGLGLFALASLPQLRRQVMREGVMPQGGQPALMQPSFVSPPGSRATLDAGMLQSS